jgi:hypothetical protein
VIEYIHIAVFLVLVGFGLAILWDGYIIRKKQDDENIKRTEGILKKKISEIKSRGETK